MPERCDIFFVGFFGVKFEASPTNEQDPRGHKQHLSIVVVRSAFKRKGTRKMTGATEKFEIRVALVGYVR